MWKQIDEVKPPNGQQVMTCINDKKGTRNECVLIFENGLWWHRDKSMYVYYAPTHWKEM